jgi:hypothetical protein
MCRADILDAHPWPDSRRQAASVVAQKRAGIVGIRCRLTGRYGFFEQMEKQQIPKIDPYGVADAAGFRAKAAGPTAQRRHQWRQFVYVTPYFFGHRYRPSQSSAVNCQQAGQCAVRFLPLRGLGDNTVFWPKGWGDFSVRAVHSQS